MVGTVRRNPAPVDRETEMPQLHRLSVFLLLVAIALAMTPASAGASGAPDEPAGCEGCCEQGDQPAPRTTGPGNGTSPSDSCCPDGCHSCFLPCCAGAAALGASYPTPESGPVPDEFFAGIERDVPSVHPAEIYHPPRS